MVVKAAIGFLSNRTPQQITYMTDVVLDAINAAKASFASPVPPPSVVEAANEALKVAIVAAAAGGREQVAIKHAKTVEVVSLMRQLAGYVTATANGDMTVLVSSGFPIQKPTRQPVGELAKQPPPTVRQGKNTGQAVATTPPVYGAAACNWRLALASAPNTYLRTVQTVGGRVTLDGLTPGELYNLESNVVGAAGVSSWSNAGQLRVV